MNERRKYIADLVDAGGPLPTQYDEVNRWANELFASLDAGATGPHEIEDLRRIFTPAHSPETMHGMAYLT